ncbi:MAG: hypothetical protein ACR2RL_13385 [Gammaproteobacteria bacterium]
MNTLNPSTLTSHKVGLLPLAGGLVTLLASIQATAQEAIVQQAPSEAQAAAGVASAAEVGDQATPALGRLFLTPEQRRQLDELRNRKPLPAQVVRAVEPEAEPAPDTELVEPEGPVVSELTVNGMVLRKGGLSAAWVNGSPIWSGSVTREGIVVRTGRGSVRVVLPSGAQSMQIKPGQMIDVETGSVYEPYDVQEEEQTGPLAFGPDAGDELPARGEASLIDDDAVQATQPRANGPAAGTRESIRALLSRLVGPSLSN